MTFQVRGTSKLQRHACERMPFISSFELLNYSQGEIGLQVPKVLVVL